MPEKADIDLGGLGTRPQEENSPADAARAEIERLFKDHNGALVRFLRAKLHSPQEALDVAQEAYVQLLGLRDTSTVSYLQAYLFKTAENLANNRLRYGSRRRQLDELIFFETESAKSPEYAVAAEQEVRLVERALMEMPADVVRALVLVKFDGLNFEQAGRVMGLSGLRVSRFVSRALAHLERALESAENLEVVDD